MFQVTKTKFCMKVIRIFRAQPVKLLFLSVPSIAPSYIRLLKLHLAEVKVQWNPLTQEDTSGHLLGHRVYYMEYNHQHYPYYAKSVNTSSANVTMVILRDLRQLTAYQIAVAAFTSKGEGPRSSWSLLTTGNAFVCSRY